ncbi:hypothetical protein BDD12DRAFT_819393 [Trichophaea hybrida]|nr:hypothetical protein BDD12DRAFT_819393 [Trichophaea hybrida]
MVPCVCLPAQKVIVLLDIGLLIFSFVSTPSHVYLYLQSVCLNLSRYIYTKYYTMEDTCTHNPTNFRLLSKSSFIAPK